MQRLIEAGAEVDSDASSKRYSVDQSCLITPKGSEAIGNLQLRQPMLRYRFGLALAEAFQGLAVMVS